MKNAMLFAILVFPLCLACCSGDPHEELYDDLNGVVTEMTGILEDVEDEESAKEAAEELVGLGGRMRELQRKYEESNVDVEGASEELRNEKGEELSQNMAKLQQEMMRVARIEGAGEHLERAFDAMMPNK